MSILGGRTSSAVRAMVKCQLRSLFGIAQAAAYFFDNLRGSPIRLLVPSKADDEWIGQFNRPDFGFQAASRVLWTLLTQRMRGVGPQAHQNPFKFAYR